ncbi:hypothetical protein [Sphingorhabdus sp.]|jgi:hypothetical protein|uniref:hypothetical protein n=1 Tax=Sphingorhabdus sp. TaxID=1902408 RepID=UPI0037CBFC18
MIAQTGQITQFKLMSGPENSQEGIISSPRNSDDVRIKIAALLHEKFSDYQALWVENHLRLLCNLRHTFGNDLDKSIILAVVGQRMFQIGLDRPIDFDQARTGNYALDLSRMTNVESISEATGIPRETVRRKVSELLEIGWLERGAKGGLSVTPQATDTLESATQIIAQLLGTMFDALARDPAISGPGPSLTKA